MVLEAVLQELRMQAFGLPMQESWRGLWRAASLRLADSRGGCPHVSILPASKAACVWLAVDRVGAGSYASWVSCPARAGVACCCMCSPPCG